MIQTFNVDTINRLTSISRSGNLTVAGTTTSPATSVTVADNGNPAVAATVYSDNTFARQNVSLVNGNNSFTAVAQDNLGRSDTNTVTVNLPTSITFSYDANGSLTSDGTRSFFYDDENQLTNVTVTGSWKVEFAYDGLGRRRTKREYNGTGTLTNEIRYVYDRMLLIQDRNANNIPTLTYSRGLDLTGSFEGAGGIGGLLGRTDPALGQTSYYQADSSGNVTGLINNRQVFVAKYIYDPYGNLISKSGPFAEANLYRFSSKEDDVNSGLYYYGYRFYDRNLQRWLNHDPISERGGLNLYGFVGNNPNYFVDAIGLSWWDGIRGGLVGVGIGIFAGAVAVTTLPATAAAALAIGAAALGGYFVGNNAYELLTAEQAYTGRPLTEDEWTTRGGRSLVDIATLGITKCKWFHRGADKDVDWLKMPPRQRIQSETDKITVSPTRWEAIKDIPVGERQLAPWNIDATQYPNTFGSGASPGLRAVWPFALGGSSILGQTPQP